MKTCKKCGNAKPITEFHRDPSMREGISSKCKSCAHKQESQRRQRLSSDPKRAMSEREKKRIYNAAYRMSGRFQRSKYDRSKYEAGYRERHREKLIARSAVNHAIRDGKLVRLPCERCGAASEAHHEDYSKPLDVTWLCPKHHAERHCEIRDEKRARKLTAA